MSYNPTTDFIALLRQTAGGTASMARMPGLDYVLDALARAGLFTLSIGQNPPTTNQQSTVWLDPSSPSWVTEGAVFLWDASLSAYVVATPALWRNLLAPSGYVFQSANAASNVIADGTSILAVQRAAPTATTLVLPTLLGQWRSGAPLRIVDWSTGVANHVISLTPRGSDTIMRLPTWQLLSTQDQLSGVTLHPSPDLNGWVIAP